MRSFDASMHADADIPFEAVAGVVAEVRRASTRVVVIGAVARDLLGSLAGGISIARATRDVDVAVAVDSMADYGRVTQSLEPTATAHRYAFHNVPVDIVPFGGAARAGLIRFDDDFELDATGLAETAETAVAVTLPQREVVPLAALEAQSALKLLAWRDRGTPNNRKDAQDLQLILEAQISGSTVGLSVEISFGPDVVGDGAAVAG